MNLKDDYKITDWLPITKKEATNRGWDELDIILVSGDAYVDHPAFGNSIIGRILEKEGFKIGIIPQPNWTDDLRDFKKFGKPRLFFGVTSGNMDSMVNHYTANKRLRSNDAYTPGNVSGFRPDYATSVYSNILKKLFPDTPVVIGGIEASLRRVTHYDYWSDKLKPSILEESSADILVYGMGETPIVEIARLIDKGVPISQLTSIPQTAIILKEGKLLPENNKTDTITLHSHEKCLRDKKSFAENFKIVEQQSNSMEGSRLIQHVKGKTIVINPANPTRKIYDEPYDLFYTRLPHPKYKKRGNIPAYEMIKHSINIHRGCFGGCSFCTISAHQGKFISNRSQKSIMKELDEITQMEDFKGHITDLGGPSANMYQMEGIDLEQCKKCLRPSCIFPSICSNLNTNHQPLNEIYEKVRKHSGIKKVTIGSGIRYDLLVGRSKTETKENHCDTYLENLIKYHVSGRLKVAPEHTDDEVLKLMRKPSFSLFYKLKEKFDAINKAENTKQQLIPYFISSHPASTLKSMADLALKTKEMDFHLEQVQDFTPTPMTVATVIFYSGYHPYTLKKVYTATAKHDKLDQQTLFFWYKPGNKQKVSRILAKAGLSELVTQLFSRQKQDYKKETRSKKTDSLKTKNFKTKENKYTRNKKNNRR
ncbi:MAG: YgiQ family radical SAM protein [Bacteroidota bacterium]|nr:YgiQ family radical SAM protein [Bacteroidota bacterium]